MYIKFSVQLNQGFFMITTQTQWPFAVSVSVDGVTTTYDSDMRQTMDSLFTGTAQVWEEKALSKAGRVKAICDNTPEATV